MSANLFKEKICVEDVELSLDTSVEQTRGTLTPFNAFFIPYNTTELSVGVALNNRYTKAETQADFARLGGNDTVAFKVFPAINLNEATSKQQVEDYLKLKADKSNVLELNNSNLYTPLSDYNPATKRYVDQQLGEGGYLPITGGTMTGQIKGITPLDDADLTRKDYVDVIAEAKYDKVDHIAHTTGVADAGKPIVLSEQGQLDPSLISANSFRPIAPWTPVPGAEYPDTSTSQDGDFWWIENVTDPYTFVDVGGELEGRDIRNGDFMVWAVGGWAIMIGEMNPLLYYKLDGTIAITENFAGGGNKIVNIADGTVATDAVTLGQMTTANDAQDVTILAAQTDADTAQTTADGALPKSGGTVIGQIKGIAPAADADLTRKDYVDALFGSNPPEEPTDIVNSLDPFGDGSLRHKFLMEDATALVGEDASNDSVTFATAGVYGNAGRFVLGSGLEVVISNVASAVFSYSVFLNPDVSAEQGYVIDFSVGRGILKCTNGELGLYNGTSWYEGLATIPTGSFSHVVLTSDGASIKLFVDKVEVYNSAIVMQAISGQFYIGSAQHSVSNFVGYIDQLEIYAKVLEQAEIDALFEQKLSTVAKLRIQLDNVIARLDALEGN